MMIRVMMIMIMMIMMIRVTYHDHGRHIALLSWCALKPK